MQRSRRRAPPDERTLSTGREPRFPSHAPGIRTGERPYAREPWISPWIQEKNPGLHLSSRAVRLAGGWQPRHSSHVAEFPALFARRRRRQKKRRFKETAEKPKKAHQLSSSPRRSLERRCRKVPTMRPPFWQLPGHPSREAGRLWVGKAHNRADPTEGLDERGSREG